MTTRTHRAVAGSVPGVSPVIEEERRAAGVDGERVLDHLAHEAGVEASDRRVAEGDPATAILDVATGCGGSGRVNSALELVGRSPCPVMLAAPADRGG